MTQQTIPSTSASTSHASSRERALALVAAGATVLLWASSFSVIRVVGEEISAGPLAFARVAIAAILLTPFALRHRGPLPLLPRGSALVRVLAYGLMWFAGYFVALNEAERHVDAATAALAVNLAPVLIALGAATLLREGLTKYLVVGTLMSFAGVSVMGLGTDTSQGANTIGIVLGVVAALLYAAAVLIQKGLLGQLPLIHVTWLGCTVGAAALTPFLPQLLGELADASPASVAWTLYLGVFPTAVGFCAWGYALKRLPASKLGGVGYLVTVVSVLMSWVFLSEIPTALVLAGGAVCVAGVAVSRRT